MLAFTVPGIARGKGRPRATTRGGFVSMYTDKQTVAYERKCAVYARRAMDEPTLLEGPLSLSIEVRIGIPKSWSKKQRANAASGVFPPITRSDIDNFCKVIMDGLNGVVWADDNQVVELYAVKKYSELPCARVAISAYEGDSDD